MKIPRKDLETLVFDGRRGQRFTQDSPVMPDVWFGFGDHPAAPMSLLLLPRREVRPASLSLALQGVPANQATETRGTVAAPQAPPGAGDMAHARIAYDESYVVADLTITEMLRLVLPLTGWWDTEPGRLGGLSARSLTRLLSEATGSAETTPTGCWFLKLVGTLLWAAEQPEDETCEDLPEPGAYGPALARALRGLRRPARRPPPPLVWSVNRNRRSSTAVWSSTKTVKADAARLLFSTQCAHLNWAVLDTGIDATHPAFRQRTASDRLRAPGRTPASVSRVRKTYDFSRIRDLLHECAGELPPDLGGRATARAAELRRRLLAGQSIDWELLEPLLAVPHDASYQPPVHPHGTHVAGLLGADWRRSDPNYDAHDEFDLIGMCPDIWLYDLRVLGEDGTGDEFSILAALQFIRWLNARKRRPTIQGVNLSLSIPHDVSNYACGRTPVCEEAARVHSGGVVVVAAAGNQGYVQYLTPGGQSDAYRNISVTDPGNTEQIITVGATHRRHPHTYGVSYFSSRGPTGDGRAKPDLVAPGEKVKGPVPDSGAESMDGTSMAAPHVSGAAALIMSRHPEFIGDPDRIKQVLCDTATDLGRERYFQGSGLVDVCRALQSI